MIKRTTICFLAMLALSAAPTFAGSKTNPAAKGDAVMQTIAKLQSDWARALYKTTGKSGKLSILHRLEKQLGKLVKTHPSRAEPKVWSAIILASDAGISGGLSALSKVKKAKSLLLASLKDKPAAMTVSALTTLGSLYYQVPGWPIAFGDNAKAEKYLKRALRIDPKAIDPNYYYADFLQKQGHKRKARLYLKRALNAPARPARPLADRGRRRLARKLLKKL